jgi:hypothetical protein
VPGRPWFGLYRGDDADTEGVHFSFAGPEGSMLILGPPRSGKTSSLVIPSVLDAPAAVVSTSTKPDVLEATVLRRGVRGRCFVFDPSATVAVPQGSYPLRWSPLVGCEDFEIAVAMAHALAGAARPGSALTESAHWVERAEALLAPLLFAAALRCRDMSTLCRWVLARDLREPLATLEASGHKMACAVMAGVAQTEDRERSGIFSSAAGLLAAYRSEAALTTTREPNFNPAAFARSSDALYICAPGQAQEQLAPIVVALLEQIRAAVYARPADAAPVVFALDEVAGIAPLPSLPQLAAEGAGQGLVTMACVQDLSQARARWGAEAEGFFSLFNSKVIFPGIGDQRTLSLVSALAGEQVVPVRSRTSVHPLAALLASNAPLPSTTKSITWRPSLPVDEVSRGRPGQVLCLAGGGISWFSVSHWRRHGYWSQLAAMTVPEYSEIVSTSPADTDPVAGATYRQGDSYPGPRVVRASSDPGGLWVWIDNGTASVAQRFAPPPPLDPGLEPNSLDPMGSRSDDLGALADPEGDHDPLFDERRDSTSGGGEGSVALVPEGTNWEDVRVVTVQVLGPPEVTGWLLPPERAVVTELACYLALHRDRPTSGEQLRAAVRPDDEREPSAKTMRTYLSLLRKAIGADYLPSGGGGGYRFSWLVTSDWEGFNQMSAEENDLKTRLYALELIRGRPLEGVPAGTYGWVFSELWISQMETAIASAALSVGTECLESGLLEKAQRAVHQGLLAVPYDLSLWGLRLRVAEAIGPTELSRAKAEAAATLDADLLSSLGELSDS